MRCLIKRFPGLDQAKPVANSKDQADGLRRLRAAPLASLCTLLSAGSAERKTALLHQLANHMARRGRSVLVLNARASGLGDDEDSFSHAVLRGAAASLFAPPNAGAADAASLVKWIPVGEVWDNDAISSALRSLASSTVRCLVDAELDAAGQLPLGVLSEGELVLHVDVHGGGRLDMNATSLREAYKIMGALKTLALPGTLSLLVTGASVAQARQVQANLFQAASRYLAMPVRTIVPPGVARHV
mgnify:CR=1 FL=1